MPNITGGSATIDGGVRLAWADPAEFDRARALRLLGPAERARAAGDGACRPARPIPPRADAAARPRRGRRRASRPEEVDGDGRRASAAAPSTGGPALRWPDAAGPPPTRRAWPRAHGLVVAALAPAGRRGRRRRGAAAGVARPRGRAPRGRIADACSAAASRSAVRRWVRAEAVLKADGRGLRVEPGRGRRATGALATRRRRARRAYRIVDRRIEGCLVSVAVVGPVPRP